MSWNQENISDVAIIGDGAHASIKRVETGVPYLTSKNFKADGLDLTKLDFISESDYQKHFKEKSKALTKPQENDLVVGIIGTLGSPYLVRNSDRFGLSSSVAILRPDSKKILPKYLLYWMKSPTFQHSINQIKSGVAQSFLSLGMIGSLPVCYSQSLDIQQRIAGVLSAYDDLIENNLKRIKLLEEMAQITYEEWFVRLRFPGHESTHFNQETGLPKGWEIKKVGNLIGKAPKSASIKSSDIQNSGSIPVVDQSRDFVAGFTDNPASLINVKDPVIIFGDHTRVLKFINFPFARGADGTQVIISNEKRVPQHLFYHALLNLDLSNYHYARHYKFLKELEIVVPDLAVASKYELITKEQFDAIKNLRYQNQHLREARDILLTRLMTGVIDVESYDPSQFLKDTA